MTELNLRRLIPEHLGVSQLCALLEDPHCTLQTLSLAFCSITEECFRSLSAALRSNPSHLRKLNLQGNKVGDSEMKHICSLLVDPNCKLESLRLSNCSLTERSCRGLGSVLSKTSSNLKDLDLSGNSIGDVGVQKLCSGLKSPNCSLGTLKLSDCGVTEKGYAILASALKLNPSHLRELDLRGNNPGTSGVKVLLDLNEDPRCILRNIKFLKSVAAEGACAAVISAVGSNPLLMTELNLCKLIPKHLGVTQLCDLLEDSHCRPQELSLANCSITEEGFRSLLAALRSNPSHLRELSLQGNKVGDSEMKHICSLLVDPKCKLENLDLNHCNITEEGFRSLAAALRSKPSSLSKLWLWGNQPGPSTLQLFSELQKHDNCKHVQIHGLK